MLTVPEGFAERLTAWDRNLKAVWNNRISRWQILRSNPRHPHDAPEHVLTVRGPDGGFQPLDNRALEEIRRRDLWKRFDGRDERYFSGFVRRELEEEQTAMNLAKEKKSETQLADVGERLTYNLKKAELRSRVPADVKRKLGW